VVAGCTALLACTHIAVKLQLPATDQPRLLAACQLLFHEHGGRSTLRLLQQALRSRMLPPGRQVVLPVRPDGAVRVLVGVDFMVLARMELKDDVLAELAGSVARPADLVPWLGALAEVYLLLGATASATAEGTATQRKCLASSHPLPAAEVKLLLDVPIGALPLDSTSSLAAQVPWAMSVALCCAVLCCAAAHARQMSGTFKRGAGPAVLCCAVLCCAVLCRAVPCCAVPCHATQCIQLDA